MVLCVLATLVVKAYDYPYLIFQKTDSTLTAMDATGLSMQVSGTTLQVTNAAGTQSFALSELSRMYFGVTDTATDLRGQAASGTEWTAMDVYTLSGEYVGRFETIRDASLPAGVYVINKGKESIKMVVK